MYYLTHRNVAVKMEGSYTFRGEQKECNNDCLMGEDSFRAHMNYPVNYWQAQVQTTLQDGRTFGFFLGDGIGSHMGDKSGSEDFAKLDGKIHKLSMSYLKEEDSENLMSIKNMTSMPAEMI